MKVKLLASAFLLSLPLISISSVNAHEPRLGVSGVFNLTVGQRVEPAYSDEPNQFDLIVNNLDGTAATVTDITLNVNVIFLKEDTFDAKVLHRALLTDKIVRDRTTPNRFNIPYMPSKPGAYGFEIEGTINGVQINEKFVCENGTQNPGKSFGCVTQIQTFPQKNKH
jgi:hypothetical protein